MLSWEKDRSEAWPTAISFTQIPSLHCTVFFLVALSFDFYPRIQMDSEEQTGGQHFMFAKYYELICEALGFFFFMRAEICFHIVAVQKCSKRSFSMYLQKCLVCVCVVLSFCMHWTV